MKKQIMFIIVAMVFLLNGCSNSDAINVNNDITTVNAETSTTSVEEESINLKPLIPDPKDVLPNCELEKSFDFGYKVEYYLNNCDLDDVKTYFEAAKAMGFQYGISQNYGDGRFQSVRAYYDENRECRLSLMLDTEKKELNITCMHA